jgi:leucyl-tRNA synthetase family protein
MSPSEPARPEPARYDAAAVEPTWRAAWEAAGCFRARVDPARPKYYVLEMFPYPSGRIHMGHVRNYAMGDVVARYKRARGFNVLHPMGWDAFGMPAENAAMERGVHPGAWTRENIATMKAQLKLMGLSLDWEREIATCEPEYYGHQQALFLDMLAAGLVYRRASMVNWDPVDMTVLANEQVIDGKGWRSGAPVERRELTQWFFRITDMAEELLSAIDGLEAWPEKVRAMQRNWIGRSEGLEMRFALNPDPRLGEAEGIDVYTTRPDTLFGAGFVALSPDHPLTKRLEAQSPDIAAFCAECRRMGTSEADLETAEKRGLDTGLTVRHPFEDRDLPVWIANFILMDYGTGAIFGCAAHDQRDLDFARKYGLPVIPVVAPSDAGADFTVGAEAYTGPGRIVNSRFLNGMSVEDAKAEVIRRIAEAGQGRARTNWRLRDWGISRQRYWGCPIPVIHCAACGVVPVPRDRLPVRLPDDVTFDAPGNPLERRRSAARDRHHGHLRRFVVVFRALHRAGGGVADRSGGGRLLDERRSVHRRGRARDPAPAVFALLRPRDAAHGLASREVVGTLRGAVHAGHGVSRDLSRRRRPLAVARRGRGARRRDGRSGDRRPGDGRAVDQDVEIEEERGRSRTDHRGLRRRRGALVHAVGQPARARRGMDRGRRRGGGAAHPARLAAAAAGAARPRRTRRRGR